MKGSYCRHPQLRKGEGAIQAQTEHKLLVRGRKKSPPSLLLLLLFFAFSLLLVGVERGESLSSFWTSKGLHASIPTPALFPS